MLINFLTFFYFFLLSNDWCDKREHAPSDTDELLKNEEIEPTIQQPSSNKKKKKYLGRINYKVRIELKILLKHILKKFDT